MTRLPKHQLVFARTLWEQQQQECIEALTEAPGSFPATLDGWLAYCEWCYQEYGVYPDGT
jgi:hypothetical protein